jgi:RNA polymerase sigma-70 factor (ECF subfamily)
MTHSETPLSLLERLGNTNDEAAWDEFSRRYCSVIRQWCRKWGLQAADADDLIQETTLIVISQVSDFRRHGIGSFRAWMKTIAWRCWRRVESRTRRLDASMLDETIWLSPKARENLLEDFDRLAHQELLQTCMDAVRGRVESTTWQAFSMTALDEKPAQEVAVQLGLSVGAVYMARSRVQRHIADELKKLDPD